MLCLFYHRSFDGVVAIDNTSNGYIKRLNNIEIDKPKCVILGLQVTIFHCLPCFKPLVTALAKEMISIFPLRISYLYVATEHSSNTMYM